MIRPQIKGLPMTKLKKKAKESSKIGMKGKGNLKGEFLGNGNMVR